jgi:hypothetical protein
MKRNIRECYKQAKTNAAREGIEPPEETAELREEWLSGRLSFEDYLAKLREHYREEPCGIDEELLVPNLLGIRDPAKLRAAEYDFVVAREVEFRMSET